MGYRIGEYYHDEIVMNARIVTELYQNGFNRVPRVILGDNKLYGELKDENHLAIQIDRYFDVNGRVREGIRSDLGFKINLRKTVWNELQAFKKATDDFNLKVSTNRLTAEHLEESFKAHIQVLTLVELNFALPYTWYQDMLNKISEDTTILNTSDFSYCEIMPHTLIVRWAKLRLALKLLRGKGKISDEDIEFYITYYSYLDRNIHPLEKPALKKNEIIEEIIHITERQTINEIKDEIRTISTNREKAKDTYYQNLLFITELMREKGFPQKEIQNFISALTIISLTATEEEYRHILQDKYWRALGLTLERLELPVKLVSRSQIIDAINKQPNFM